MKGCVEGVSFTLGNISATKSLQPETAINISMPVLNI